jgi:hypothetical protein
MVWYVRYIELQLFVASVQSISVDTHCIWVGILRSDYIGLLFVLSVLYGFVLDLDLVIKVVIYFQIVYEPTPGGGQNTEWNKDTKTT